jgi:hypothetical protein
MKTHIQHHEAFLGSLNYKNSGNTDAGMISAELDRIPLLKMKVKMD